MKWVHSHYSHVYSRVLRATVLQSDLQYGTESLYDAVQDLCPKTARNTHIIRKDYLARWSKGESRPEIRLGISVKRASERATHRAWLASRLQGWIKEAGAISGLEAVKKQSQRGDWVS